MIPDRRLTPSTTIQEPPLDTSLVIPGEIERIRQMIAKYRMGSIEESLFRRFRLQYGIYGIRNQTGVQMVRVKVPFGRLTASQLEVMASVAENYASGHGHVTTRQDLQFYWIPLDRVPDMLAALGDVGITTREASGNVVRNLTADPLAGVAVDEVFDVRPYANAVARFLLRNPISQNLGRKFKISFSGSPADRAFAGIQDIGAIARIEEEGGFKVRGFDIFVGGGLGANPRLANRLEAFTPAVQLLPTVEAIIRIFNRLGNRENRKKARLKFLVAQVGMDAFRELVFQERAVLPMVNAHPYPDFAGEHIGWTTPPHPVTALPSKGGKRPLPGDPSYRQWYETNVIWQKQSGYAAVFVTLPAGDITAPQFRSLAEIARRFAGGEVYTTITQNIAFRWISKNSLADLYQALKETGLAAAGTHWLPDVVGCAGADTCNLGITTSHRLVQELIRRLSHQPDRYLAADLRGIDIKIGGCPNACGHHHIAAIGLQGGARRINGQLVPHYRLLLGGRVTAGGTVLGTPVVSIPARNVPQAVERVVTLYRAGFNPGESFYEWIDRVGPTSLKGAFKDLQSLPDPDQNPHAYRDWGQETTFSIQVGESECAV